jgi:hypothetical protein
VRIGGEAFNSAAVRRDLPACSGIYSITGNVFGAHDAIDRLFASIPIVFSIVADTGGHKTGGYETSGYKASASDHFFGP